MMVFEIRTVFLDISKVSDKLRLEVLLYKSSEIEYPTLFLEF